MGLRIGPKRDLGYCSMAAGKQGGEVDEEKCGQD